MSEREDVSKTNIWTDPALAALVERDTAAILWSLDGSRVISASAQTWGLAPALRAAGGESLRLRLRRVASALSVGNGVRLERISLPRGYGVARLLLECHRVLTGKGEFLLTILRGALPRLPRIVEQDFIHNVLDENPQEIATGWSARTGAVASAEQLSHEKSAGLNAVQRLQAYAGSRAMVRFIWETDAHGRFTRISQELAGLVGKEAGEIEGRSWRELVEMGVVCDNANVTIALSHNDTWSGREVLWRIGADGCMWLPVELAGIPVHDATRRFQGFRGFGLCRVKQLRTGTVADKGVAENPAPVKENIDTINEEETTLPPSAVTSRSILTDSEKQAFRDIARALVGSHAGEEHLPARSLPQEMSFLQEKAQEVPAPLKSRAEEDFAFSVEKTQQKLITESQPFAKIHGEIKDFEKKTSQKADIAPLRPAEQMEVAREELETLSAQKGINFFKGIADRLPLGMLVSRENKILFVNRAFLDLLGYETAADFIAAGGLETLFTRTPHGGEAPLALLTARGRPLSVDARMVSIPWEGTTAMLMSFRRALEPAIELHLRNLERNLRDQEMRLKELDTILDTATDGVITFDHKGSLLSLNRSAEALLEQEETDVLGMPFWKFLTAESMAAAQTYFEGLQAGGLASVLNDGQIVTACTPKGSIKLMMIIGRLAADDMKDTAKDHVRFFAILRDMSSAISLSEPTKAAETTVSQEGQAEFLARVSHEIRSPLNAILGFTEMILEERYGPIGSERYREYLQDIHSSGGQVINLVNELLDLARIEAGRLELTPTIVSLNDVVSHCVGLLMPQAGRQRVVLRTSLGRALPEICIDERALQQIILNLLSNAVKFTDAGGQVIVSTARADEGGATLRIRDTGTGMTQAQVSAALEPFANLTTTRLTHEAGTGLGLPLTRALVEASGGRFHLTSAPHEGTMVEIIFPAKTSVRMNNDNHVYAKPSLH